MLTSQLNVKGAHKSFFPFLIDECCGPQETPMHQKVKKEMIVIDIMKLFTETISIWDQDCIWN